MDIMINAMAAIQDFVWKSPAVKNVCEYENNFILIKKTRVNSPGHFSFLFNSHG